jgi:hypothetical protein
VIRKTILAALALTSIPVVWCQSVQSPYSSNYALVSLGPVPSFGNYYGSLTFLNASALLLTDGVEGGSVPIYQLPVNRGPDGHITSLGTPVHYASAAFLDAGLAFGPGGILFARNTNSVLYEFKPGSTSPDLSVDLTTFGYPHDSFGTLQFVPPGLPGAGSLKVPDFSTGKWYDVVLAPNTSGTYDVSSVNGPNATASADPMGIFYVPLGSPQFSSPSVLVAHYYTGPIYAYSLDSNGNPAGSGTAFIAGNFSPYGAAFDPLTGDMLFTTTLTGEDVYEVQGFSAGSLTGTAGGRQSAVVDRHFASPLTVTLRDPYGTPIGGVTVNFAAPTSGASAALSAGSAVTAADGTASITATANTTAGSYSVTATLYGLSTTFSFTNVALQSVALSPASVVGGGSSPFQLVDPDVCGVTASRVCASRYSGRHTDRFTATTSVAITMVDKQQQVPVAGIRRRADLRAQADGLQRLPFEVEVFGHDAGVPRAARRRHHARYQVRENAGQDHGAPARPLPEMKHIRHFAQIRGNRHGARDHVEQHIPLRAQQHQQDRSHAQSAAHADQRQQQHREQRRSRDRRGHLRERLREARQLGVEADGHAGRYGPGSRDQQGDDHARPRGAAPCSVEISSGAVSVFSVMAASNSE